MSASIGARAAPVALWVVLGCAGGTPPHPPVPRPTPPPTAEELRCRSAATPALVQRQIMGLWAVTFRPDTLHHPAMTGEIRLRAGVVRPDLSPAESVCKGCLFGEYFGPFTPLLERPPEMRSLAAIMRADYTMVMSIGSFSAVPNVGDLSLCGRWDGVGIMGIWWQNLPEGEGGTFAMARLE